MKIAIIGKRDTMGTTPSIRLKGLSRTVYPFEWDKDERRYSYEPKNQREVEDIFRTAGKIYRTIFFIPVMDETHECEACLERAIDETKKTAEELSEEKPAKAKRGRPRKEAKAA